jgi:hypothetical protein
MVSYVRVRELFDYKDGRLYNKIYRGSVAEKNKPVGNFRADGYLQLCIDYKMYRVNKIVWLWHYGYLPENVIDHINGIKDDNRIENLREVSKQCNAVNFDKPINNTSGIRGVSFSPRDGVWFAQIKINQKRYFLGQSKCKLEAACLRLAAEQCLGWDTCNSSSAYRYVMNEISCGGGACEL